jgi:hypothetical protein
LSVPLANRPPDGQGDRSADDEVATDGLRAASPYRGGMRPGPRVGFRWNRDTITYSIDLWHRRYLRAPTFEEWQRAGRDHPATSTVIRVFGSWNKAIRAAGLRARGQGGGTPQPTGTQRRSSTGRWLPNDDRDCSPIQAPLNWRWPSEDILDALLRWNLRHGRAPTQRDWILASDDHPSRLTVIRAFGSWDAGLKAAELA